MHHSLFTNCSLRGHSAAASVALERIHVARTVHSCVRVTFLNLLGLQCVTRAHEIDQLLRPSRCGRKEDAHEFTLAFAGFVGRRKFLRVRIERVSHRLRAHKAGRYIARDQWQAPILARMIQLATKGETGHAP